MATVHDLAQTFSYSPASQIIGQTRSNDVYAWTAHVNIDRSYGTNGLNQLTSAGAQSISHDARGNLTGDGANSYAYSSTNHLMVHQSGGSVSSLYYEPSSGMLSSHWANGVDTRFGWSGPDLLLERSGSSGVIQRRYVHGPGFDNPIVWYEGSGLTDRRFLMADERGSVVSVTDSAGATIAINSYDEYGIPAPTNVGRFGYSEHRAVPGAREDAQRKYGYRS